MSTQTVQHTGGIGFPGALTLAFIILKLCGVIAWSWFWVLSPVLITWGLILAIILVMLVAYAIVDKR